MHTIRIVRSNHNCLFDVDWRGQARSEEQGPRIAGMRPRMCDAPSRDQDDMYAVWTMCTNHNCLFDVGCT